MKTLIIGNGEVGKALACVLSNGHEVFIKDIEQWDIKDIKVLHICYPYSKRFTQDTKNYIKQYKPKYTVIHSTVPVGTSRKCKAYHSPIRGVHPNLDISLTTFIKYLAPNNRTLAKYFLKVNISIRQVLKTESTELAKILSTAKYGLDILFNKEAYKLSKKHGADFDIVYTDWTKTYNEGYSKMGYKQYARPVLKYIKGKIGGHCVMSNCNLLDTWITKLIKKENGKS